MPTHRCFAIISTFSLASLCLQICKPSFLLRRCLSMFFIQNCDQINETLEDCTFIFKRSKKTDYDQKCYLSYDNPHRNQTINSFKVQSHLKERKKKKKNSRASNVEILIDCTKFITVSWVSVSPQFHGILVDTIMHNGKELAFSYIKA